MPVLGQIWPFLGPKSNFLRAGSKNFGTLVSGVQWDTFFVLKTLISGAQIGHWGQKCAFLTPKFGYLGPKVNFLFSDRDFCWWNKWPLYPGLQLSHRNHPKKIFRFWARGHFFGAHPCFWPFLAIDALEGQLPLILVRFQRNSGESSGPSKKWPRRTTDPVRAGITEKRAFLRSAEKWFLA